MKVLTMEGDEDGVTHAKEVEIEDGVVVKVTKKCLRCGVMQEADEDQNICADVRRMDVHVYPNLINRECRLCGGVYNPFDRGRESQLEEEWYVHGNTGRLICNGCGHSLGIDKHVR